MKLIIISSADSLEKEHEIITDLFRAGLKTFHLRKPKYSTAGLKRLISKIPAEFHNRIVIHSHHNLARVFNLKGIHLTKKHKYKTLRTWLMIKWLKMKRPHLVITTSFNRLSGILDETTEKKYDYVFLSPIFDNHRSKYQAGFTEHSLAGTLKKTHVKVVARGGIEVEHVKKVNELGFYGLSVRGEMWSQNNPVEIFQRYINRFTELNIPLE